jgi:hypothetical protein
VGEVDIGHILAVVEETLAFAPQAVPDQVVGYSQQVRARVLQAL